MKKQLLVLLLSFIGIANLNAHRITGHDHVQSTEKAVTNEHWIFLEQSENIEIYYRYSTCDNTPALQFQVVNNNDHPIFVSWATEIILNETAIPVDTRISLELEANSTVSGNCDYTLLSLNPYDYVSVIQVGETACSINNLKIEKK